MSKNYMDGDLTFGQLWGHGVHDYLETAEMDEMDYITVEEFQPFGDPSLAIAEESQPPEKPENLDGPLSGKINQEYKYNASTTDPDEDQLYYLFEWGDGEFSEWIGPIESGETAETSHIWTKPGEYEIRVKAKDEHGVQSPWSDPLQIKMPRTRVFSKTLFTRLPEVLTKAFQIFRYIIEKKVV